MKDEDKKRLTEFPGECNRQCFFKVHNWTEGFCGKRKDKPEDTFKCEYYQGTASRRDRYGGPREFKRGTCIGPFGD